MRYTALRLLALATSCLLARSAFATTANDICPAAADPCLVTTSRTVTPGSTLDFGARALQVRPTGRLVVSGGTLTILARSVRLEPGGDIDGMVGQGFGATLRIEVTDFISVEASGSSVATIDVSANTTPGQIDLIAGGNVDVAGRLSADGTGVGGSGGIITISAGGRITLDVVNLRGGVPGLGGSLTAFAMGPVSVNDSILASGGDGGDIDIESGTGSITTATGATMTVSGGGTYGDAGLLTLTAANNITLNGEMVGAGAGSPSLGGGFGASVSLTADTGSISVNSPIDCHGAAPDGEGGQLDFVAGLDIVHTAAVFLQDAGFDACGGSYLAFAGRNTNFSAPLAVNGGFCGGEVEIDTGVSAQLGSEINSDGIELGGSIFVAAPSISTTGRLHAAASGSFGGAGLVHLLGCNITVGSTSQLVASSAGGGGMNLLQGSGQITIFGDVRATGGSNVFEYRDPSKVPIYTPANVTPAPQLVNDPNLLPCPIGAVCGNGTQELGEECDDSNTLACDGCSPTCNSEGCGNGRVECGEECDDGPANGGPGSTCDATCHVVQSGPVFFVPGTRRGPAGCVLEWTIVNPNGEVESGFPSSTQTCIDGDPSCDADGAIDGGCDLQVGACLNSTDSRLPLCNSAGVDYIQLRRPNPVSPADDVDEANAETLVDAFADLNATVKFGTTVLHQGVVDTQDDHCTGQRILRVPHAPGVTGRRLLLATAKETGRTNRRNRMVLACAHNPAVCGNGDVEVGEQCDDGNTASCDGCTSTCRIERCGDSIVQCGEQCDNGSLNGTPGNPCTATCTQAPPPLRIPGGPSRGECTSEFSLVHDAPVVGRNGLPSTLQSCVDGDATCDFDPTPGRCRFRLFVCLGEADDRVACPAKQVTAASVTLPSANQTANAAARQALVDALGALEYPLGPGEVCSGRVDVDVPAGTRRLNLGVSATAADGRRDRDTLKLRCIP
jgi:cysteine-rich repeat protein